jgi:hypothetical protein
MLVIDGKYSSDDGLTTITMINNAVIFRKIKLSKAMGKQKISSG